MKRLLTFLFVIAICHQVYAQKTIFVRVYNLNGKKINTGRVLAITDSSLQIKGESKDTFNVSINSIGTIKTKRSTGHNVLMGSLLGAGAFAIAGVATADPNDEIVSWSAGEGVLAGIVVGAPIGAAVGGITAAFKKIKTFEINGSIEKWKAFQIYISEVN